MGNFSRLLIFILLFGVIYFLFKTGNSVKSYSRALTILVRNPDRGILILNNHGLIKQVNHTLIKQLHLTEVEIKNHHYKQVFRKLPQVHQFIDALFHEKIRKSEDVLITEKRFTFRGRLFGRPISGLLGYPSGFYFETNDFARPVQNDRLKVWSRTVQKMAHDIKTPLSSISVNLSTVKLKLSDLAPEAHSLIEDDLEIMLNEMERVREMTRNFLKFTNLEQPNLSTFSLGLLLQDVLDHFKSYYAQEKTQDMVLDFDFEPDWIHADYAQIKMVLHALIENALDALKARGQIIISVSDMQRIDRNFENNVEIEIRNNGPAIPAEIRDKIFEPYFTSKKNGTGMGLAIARKIIEDHHGSLDLISKEKFTTVFRIVLPIGNTSPTDVAQQNHS